MDKGFATLITYPNAPIETAVVVGDSVWDMLAAIRCRALGVGFLSGGCVGSILSTACTNGR